MKGRPDEAAASGAEARASGMLATSAKLFVGLAGVACASSACLGAPRLGTMESLAPGLLLLPDGCLCVTCVPMVALHWRGVAVPPVRHALEKETV